MEEGRRGQRTRQIRCLLPRIKETCRLRLVCKGATPLATKVLVTIPAAVPLLEEAVEVVRGSIETASDAIGLLVGPTDRVGREELARMPALRVLAVAGAGTDAVDSEALRQRGVQLLSAPEATVAATAELTICLSLMISRGIPSAIAELETGSWSGWSFDHVVGRGLEGLTFGLIGYGRIGRRVAELASALGMNVIHHTRRDAGLSGYVPDLGAVLQQSDIVSIHVPLTPATRGLIGQDELGMMRPAAALINTSRGGIVDEEALVQALVDGRLSGAALDVFVDEPGIPSALLEVPNLIVTPHVGTATAAARAAMVDEASKALLAGIARAVGTCE